jgi:archaemetzincin
VGPKNAIIKNMLETLKYNHYLINRLTRENSYNLLSSQSEISTFFLDKDDGRLKSAYDSERKQCNAEVILDNKSDETINPSKKKLLFIVSVDIYRPQADFIFGLSQRLGGEIAVVSTYHLKVEDEELFISRLLKETLHELGHLFGLRHCQDKFCLMSLSLDIKGIDFKKIRFCRNCRKLLER